MKKCKFCGSIWVCWNWIHVEKEKFKEMNDHLDVRGDYYVHECWRCEKCFDTYHQIKNGIPCLILKHFYNYLKNIIK